MGEVNQQLAAALSEHSQGRFAEAEQLYRELLESDPTNLQVLANLGAALQAQSRPEEARACYERVLEIRPAHAQALCNLGSISKDHGQLAEAAEYYSRALVIDDKLAEAHFSLGTIRQAQGDKAAALAGYRRVLTLRPDHAGAHYNLGLLARQDIRLAEAEVHYDEAIRLRPDFAEAHNSRALLWLAAGDFTRGWPEFEWRLQVADSPAISFNRPRWRGETRPDQTILLTHEQGLGDTIQFVRFAPRVKARSQAKVILACGPLATLLADTPNVDLVVNAWTPDMPFDAFASLVSLPSIFSVEPASLATTSPYMKADPTGVARWKQELADLVGMKIGIAWQGNPAYPADRERSIPLAQFLPLARIPGVSLVSLQKGLGQEQLANWPRDTAILDLADRLDNFAALVDTAAVMMNLDLVITSDTSIAHLAGALGVPAWVALPWLADWRWMLDRSDSPWYPSLRLFRQAARGDWSGVFKPMAQELSRILSRSATK